MATKQPKNRSEMDQAYQWDLAAMIPDESVLDGQLAQIREELEQAGFAKRRESAAYACRVSGTT